MVKPDPQINKTGVTVANNQKDYSGLLSGVKPVQGMLNQDTDTVSGQLKGLLSEGSDLMTGARTRAKQEYNSRGLMNSGNAVAAGEYAAIQSAMPIAQQDASANLTQNLTNQSNQQQFNLKQLSQDFTKELPQIGYDNNMQAALLSFMQGTINNNNGYLTQLASSPDVTAEEYENVKNSLMNSMQTWTNIWKVSAGSNDTFDFSGI